MSSDRPAALEAMVRRFKPYPQYKDSGVEWLGKIPVHWRISRLCDLSLVVNGYPFDSEYFVRGEGIPLVRIRDLYHTETEVGYVGPLVDNAWIEPGEVIIGMDGDFNVARWRGPRALLNQRLCCVRARKGTLPGFIAYALPFPLALINTLTYSTTVRHLSSADVKRIRLGEPPEDEQRAIGAFLDRETARVDSLIAKKERLLELLQERRIAVISRAVTKGLNPNVPITDSGVEWLGEIPCHWSTDRLKHLVREPLRYGANEPAELTDPNLPRYIRITDIGDDGTLRDDTFRSIPEELAMPYLLADGDILLARSGATVGKAFRYDRSWGRAAHAGYLIRARLDEDRVRSRFFHYFAQSQAYWDWLLSSFIQATIQNVSAGRYANLWVPVPPVEEQDIILRELGRALGRLDRLMGSIRLAINRLKEFRTALISAAVTGQIDVREEAA